jgi:hypothetical protein
MTRGERLLTLKFESRIGSGSAPSDSRNSKSVTTLSLSSRPTGGICSAPYPDAKLPWRTGEDSHNVSTSFGMTRGERFLTLKSANRIGSGSAPSDSRNSKSVTTLSLSSRPTGGICSAPCQDAKTSLRTREDPRYSHNVYIPFTSPPSMRTQEPVIHFAAGETR